MEKSYLDYVRADGIFIAAISCKCQSCKVRTFIAVH